MTEKEAIETLQEKSLERCEAFGFYCGNCDKCEVTIAYDMAIKALEKQMPKKVENYTIDCYGYMIYDCECPSCKTEHKEMYPFAYCPHCGQALDWSGDCE